MTDAELIARLRDLGDHAAFEPHMHHVAADRIELLATTNKELSLQLLATHGQAADALDKLAKAVAGLEKCQEELDEYSRQEYPLDHPVHERYRQRDYDANTARATLAEIKSGVATTPYRLEGESHD